MHCQLMVLSNGFLGDYSGTQGLGLLRLHSTYRHDLKIYASDEGKKMHFEYHQKLKKIIYNY